MMFIYLDLEIHFFLFVFSNPLCLSGSCQCTDKFSCNHLADQIFFSKHSLILAAPQIIHFSLSVCNPKVLLAQRKEK